MKTIALILICSLSFGQSINWDSIAQIAEKKTDSIYFKRIAELEMNIHELENAFYLAEAWKEVHEMEELTCLSYRSWRKYRRRKINNLINN